LESWLSLPKFKKSAESPPTAFFYNEEGEELDSVLLEGMKRLELFHMMDSRGIKRKDFRKKEEL